MKLSKQKAKVKEDILKYLRRVHIDKQVNAGYNENEELVIISLPDIELNILFINTNEEVK